MVRMELTPSQVKEVEKLLGTTLPSDEPVTLTPTTVTSEVVKKDNSVPMMQFSTGAIRGTDLAKLRYDLISPIALRRLAETCAEGSEKYGDHNWLKGFPSGDLLNHAIKHLIDYQLGIGEEDDLAHAMWNIHTLIHFTETRPDLITFPFLNQGPPSAS